MGLGGSIFAIALLIGLAAVGSAAMTFDQGGISLLAVVVALAVALGYGVLVARAVRGHRLAAAIVAATAWLVALVSWRWLVNITGDPAASLWPAAAIAPGATLYAVAATFLAIRHDVATADATS